MNVVEIEVRKPSFLLLFQEGGKKSAINQIQYENNKSCVNIS